MSTSKAFNAVLKVLIWVTMAVSRARRARGLPEYQVHDALSDAVATAELFLALRMALGARTVRDLC